MGLMPLIDWRRATPNLPRYQGTDRGEIAATRPARRRFVGLLGGSFNPAHEGHLHLSGEALRRLDLDEVWWLVSPQNPLKLRTGMAPFEARMARARQVAGSGPIRVTDLEQRFESPLTFRTVERMRAWRDFRFVFLIGADNLLQLPRWQHWRQIVHAVPIAVCDRQPYSHAAVRSAAGRALEGRRLPEMRANELKEMTTPAWVYLHMRAHPASSTAIRKDAGADHGPWWLA